MAHALITISNKYGSLTCPSPKRGLSMMVATLVDAARNADGVTVGQKIGRDQYKIDALEWSYLTAAQWSAILKKFNETFYVDVTFPDMVNNKWITLKMYPGDRHATPYWINEQTGLPSVYTECKVNIIDTGAVGVIV